MTSADEPPKAAAPRFYVVLTNACLETVKVGSSYQLLNCDDHQNFIRKHGRDIADVRPDITHQCLLNLLDSPLNKAGLLKVFIHTTTNVLIDVHPQTRIPRTFRRFCGLMVQLLRKLSIRATNGPEKLFRVIRNPITDHLPPDSIRIRTEMKASRTMDPLDYAVQLPPNKPIVMAIGAMAHGFIDLDWTTEDICLSNYALSAHVVCSKVCTAFEKVWGVL